MRSIIKFLWNGIFKTIKNTEGNFQPLQIPSPVLKRFCFIFPLHWDVIFYPPRPSSCALKTNDWDINLHEWAEGLLPTISLDTGIHYLRSSQGFFVSFLSTWSSWCLVNATSHLGPGFMVNSSCLKKEIGFNYKYFLFVYLFVPIMCQMLF